MGDWQTISDTINENILRMLLEQWSLQEFVFCVHVLVSMPFWIWKFAKAHRRHKTKKNIL